MNFRLKINSDETFHWFLRSGGYFPIAHRHRTFPICHFPNFPRAACSLLCNFLGHEVDFSEFSARFTFFGYRGFCVWFNDRSMCVICECVCVCVCGRVCAAPFAFLYDLWQDRELQPTHTKMLMQPRLTKRKTTKRFMSNSFWGPQKKFAFNFVSFCIFICAMQSYIVCEIFKTSQKGGGKLWQESVHFRVEALWLISPFDNFS